MHVYIYENTYVTLFRFIYVFIQLCLAPVGIYTYLEVVLAYVCVLVCIYVCVSVSVHVCVCACTCARCVCLSASVCVHALKERVYLSTSVEGVCLGMCVCECLRVYFRISILHLVELYAWSRFLYGEKEISSPNSQELIQRNNRDSPSNLS